MPFFLNAKLHGQYGENEKIPGFQKGYLPISLEIFTTFKHNFYKGNNKYSNLKPVKEQLINNNPYSA